MAAGAAVATTLVVLGIIGGGYWGVTKYGNPFINTATTFENQLA